MYIVIFNAIDTFDSDLVADAINDYLRLKIHVSVGGNV